LCADTPLAGGAHDGALASQAAVAAILCDLDGTLLDTVADIAAAVNAVLAGLGRAALAQDIIATYIGRGADVLLHRALGGGPDARIDAELLARARALFETAYARVNGDATRIYPGVVAGLDCFRALGVRLACVTNKPQRAAEAVLARFGLSDRFEFVIGGDALAQRKPDPEPLLHAAARLGIAPRACVALGDSANDALAARGAGMPVVLVDYGYTEGRPIGEIDCDAVVASFVELADALAAPRGRFAFLEGLRAG
jgi:phosphoglycolate phosphatase